MRKALVAAGILSAIWIGINAGKPVHTDDPFFLYWARVISPVHGDKPIKYFNWLRYEEPMLDETRHTPPGWSMALSGVRHAAGEREYVLHWLQWPFAVMLLSGVFMLARSVGAPPWASMLVCGTSPVFLLPSASLLGDIPAMGLGVFGLALWASYPSLAWRIAGALLLALAGQMKFSILVLFPLLVIQVDGRLNRRPRDWGLALISLVLAWTYPDVAPHDPDRASIAGNMAYLFQSTWNPGLLFMKASYLLSACGSLMFPAFLAGYTLVARTDIRKAPEKARIIAMGICAIPLLSFAGFWKGQNRAGGFWQLDSGAGAHVDVVPPTLNTLGFYLAIALFISWGIIALRKDNRCGAIWLKYWILLASTGFLIATWFPAVRHLMPVFPAMVMLFLKDFKVSCSARAWRIGLVLTVAGNLWLALSLARSDDAFARFSVDAAVRGGREAAARKLPLLTTGSWGLRYYVEREGGRILYRSSETLPAGAVMLIPTLTDRRVLPAALRARSRVLWKMTLAPPQKWPLVLPVQTIPPVATLSAWHGGYVWFPFAFSRAPTETVTALEIRPLKSGR